ncbi:hypothetical protein BYT27DRAFT_7107098 [Phlegmacium glaucopus]|nr:hypothetical protein BYT27DRAFT_7107098 [Phlegmacium glaucopus]
MMDIYPVIKQSRSQSPTLAPELSPATVDLFRAKEESFTATSLSTTAMDLDIKSECDVKSEGDASPSQSPTLVADISTQKLNMSCYSTPPPSMTDGTTSKSSTPPFVPPSKPARKAASAPIQFISDLPVARESALGTFNEIFDNNYQFKSLGRSREILESMSCDCVYEHGVDSTDNACGPYSDCINRLTQVECLAEDCRCRSYCQNQRFQQKQYANIEIVLTEKKGYGLRAETDIAKDAFIYEYVGDVVNPGSFKKRMREYAEEGIQHFYFMMLQKDEFIDATKSGGIGRFANHSCNPNCYVAKWTVGTHVRMGIFAKRDVKLHEELTFNYNVDRYGHQAQECYCGEPMCVGYIGGKTQTDIATMDDLYLDALGITDENDLMELKGTKKKKGKKIDDPDFMPTMQPILEKDVPKVVQAIRQTTSRKVLSKLMIRIKITEDQAALRQIMRLRGYSLMTNVLEDHIADLELVTLALECMSTWPLLNRNKVQDSKVHVPVEACAALENEVVKSLAQALLDHWATLPVYNRIPKRTIHDDLLAMKTLEEITPPEPRTKFISREHLPRPESYRRKRRIIEQSQSQETYYNRFPPPSPGESERQTARLEKEKLHQKSVREIIASAASAAAAEEAAAIAEAKAKADAAADKAARKKEKSNKKSLTSEEREANKEKRLLKLIGAVVVKCMSKYSKAFDHDAFKKHAKELTQVIADKEKKSSSYREGKLDTLSEEKVIKIKKFSKDYINKILRRMEKSGKRSKPPSVSTMLPTPSTSMHTPNSNDGGGDTSVVSMSVEEAMDMDPDSGSDAEDDDEMTDGERVAEKPNDIPLSQSRWTAHDADTMNLDESLHSRMTTVPSDPRRRAPPDD